jgi:hypothetical protein
MATDTFSLKTVFPHGPPFCAIVIGGRREWGVGLKRKRFFPFSQKAKMMQKWANFREISRNFVSPKFLFPRKFSRKWERFCDKHLQNDKFKRKFDDFSACPLLLSDLLWSTLRIWQFWSAWWTVLLSDFFWAFNNYEVHGEYSCPICFEAPSGFDILRYFTIFPVSCVRFLIHFRFRKSFRENFCVNFCYFRNVL